MNIETVLYLIDVLDKVQNFIGGGVVIYFLALAIVLFFCFSGCSYSYEEDNKIREQTTTILKENYKKIFVLPLCILFLISLIPSQKTMYLMLGANYLKNSTLPSKVELAIEKRIDSYLDEDKDKK